MPTVRIQCRRLSYTAQVKARLHEGAERMERAVGQSVTALAQEYAPVESGRMKNAIHNGAPGQTIVDVPYAGFVNYGTRYMECDPFLTHAVQDSIALWGQQMHSILGNGGGIMDPTITDRTPFRHGEDRGARRSPAEYRAMFASMRARGKL